VTTCTICRTANRYAPPAVMADAVDITGPAPPDSTPLSGRVDVVRNLRHWQVSTWTIATCACCSIREGLPTRPSRQISLTTNQKLRDASGDTRLAQGYKRRRWNSCVESILKGVAGRRVLGAGGSDSYGSPERAVALATADKIECRCWRRAAVHPVIFRTTFAAVASNQYPRDYGDFTISVTNTRSGLTRIRTCMRTGRREVRWRGVVRR